MAIEAEIQEGRFTEDAFLAPLLPGFISDDLTMTSYGKVLKGNVHKTRRDVPKMEKLSKFRVAK